jgi:hypothetical protein
MVWLILLGIRTRPSRRHDTLHDPRSQAGVCRGRSPSISRRISSNNWLGDLRHLEGHVARVCDDLCAACMIALDVSGHRHCDGRRSRYCCAGGCLRRLLSKAGIGRLAEGSRVPAN